MKKYGLDSNGNWFCWLCGKSFSNEGLVLTHIRKEHPKKILNVPPEAGGYVHDDEVKQPETPVLSSSSSSSSSSWLMYINKVDGLERRLGRVERVINNQLSHRWGDWHWKEFVFGIIGGFVLGFLFAGGGRQEISEVVGKTGKRALDKIIDKGINELF